MAENTKPISFSIPHDLDEFLEGEVIRCNTKKSCIMQEELYHRMHRVKKEGRAIMFFPLILLTIGILIMAFSIFLIPILFIGFLILGVIGVGSLLIGYLGIYKTLKKKVKHAKVQV